MNKFIKASSLIAILAGLALLAVGVYGLIFTYNSVARENITTPADSARPGIPVRGPLSLKIQADAMHEHMLRISGGLTYAETPQRIEQLDESGDVILDENGELVMVNNPVRNTWQTATTFMTALNLGALSYAFFSLMCLFGLACIWHGLIFLHLIKNKQPN